MLGSSETIGKRSGLFSDAETVYSKVQTDVYKKIHELSEFHKLDDIFLSLIDQYVNPCLILNDRGEIVAYSVSADQFLKCSKGNSSRVFPAGLSVPVSAALQKARKEKREVEFNHVPVYLNGKLSFITLKLERFPRQYHTLYVLFMKEEKTGKNKQPPVEGDEDQSHSDIRHLHRIIKDLEVSNEALTAANQKLMTANRELTTINQTFERKIDELSSLNDHLDHLLINTNIAALFLDGNLNVKLFTPEAAKMLQLKQSDTGRPIGDLKGLFKYADYTEDLKRMLVEKKTIQKEIKAGNGDWYAVKMIPSYSGEKAEGIVMTFSDITELKATNEALHISAQAIEQSPANILIASVDGTVQYANKRFCQLIEKEQCEIIGEHVIALYEHHFMCDELSARWKLAAEKQPWTGEIHYQDEKGRDKWEQVSLVPVEDRMGNVQQVLQISEDITNEKQSEKMLIKSEMLSAVGQLAAGIAHEIRNPLTSLRGFLQLMIQTKTYEKEYAEVMMSEFIRLESMINEFLVLAKTKSATLDQVQVNTLLKDVCMILESQAVLNNVRIEKELSEKLPEILAVSNELKQVFLNILKNAIEAMEHAEGVISIRSYREKDSVFITFEDQGKGISKEALEKLGEPFYTTKEKGTGLGLMVTFKIIENHGGSIHFESEEGKGTKVTLKLPAKE